MTMQNQVKIIRKKGSDQIRRSLPFGSFYLLSANVIDAINELKNML